MSELIMSTIFIVLFLVIRNVLDKSKLFVTGNSVLAFCVSLLAIGGMQWAFIKSNSVEWIPLLLPYAAMGIAILVTLLFMWIGKFVKWKREKWLDKEVEFLKKLSKDKKDKRVRK